MKEEQQTITGEQVEQSLEEKVRDIAAASGLIVAYVHDDEVSISSSSLQYWVTSTHVRTNSTQLTIKDYCDNDGKYSDEFNAIAALLTAQPESEQTLEEAESKPTYEDLEQRVEELEKESKRLAGDYDEVYDECEEAKKRHREARKLMERYQEDALKAKQKYDNLLTDYQRECEALENMRERLEKSEAENASLLDKFGPIDQAEQQVAEVETRFQKLAKRAERIADLLIQLNEEIL